MAAEKKTDVQKGAKKERKGKGRVKRFFKEVTGEVKKLSWPTKKELLSYTVTVLCFIILLAVIIYAMDLVFGEGLGLLSKLNISNSTVATATEVVSEIG